MRALWLTGLIAMGCESMEATPGRVPPTSAPRPSAADVLDEATVKPVDAGSEPAAAPPADAPAPSATDAAATTGSAAAPAAVPATTPAPDDVAAQAALLAEAFGSAGVPGAPAAPAVPGAAPAAAPAPSTQPPLPTPPAPAATPPSRAAWSPGTRIEGSWGVRVVSVTPRSNPPRAILGMADGTERVVEPGTMLADEHLVVMAIGEDAVQVSRVVPDGDRVRIESEILTAMYRSAPPAP